MNGKTITQVVLEAAEDAGVDQYTIAKIEALVLPQAELKKINYTDAPRHIERALDDAVITTGFLPSPSELVRKTK